MDSVSVKLNKLSDKHTRQIIIKYLDKLSKSSLKTINPPKSNNLLFKFLKFSGMILADISMLKVK